MNKQSVVYIYDWNISLKKDKNSDTGYNTEIMLNDISQSKKCYRILFITHNSTQNLKNRR